MTMRVLVYKYKKDETQNNEENIINYVDFCEGFLFKKVKLLHYQALDYFV